MNKRDEIKLEKLVQILDKSPPSCSTQNNIYPTNIDKHYEHFCEYYELDCPYLKEQGDKHRCLYYETFSIMFDKYIRSGDVEL